MRLRARSGSVSTDFFRASATDGSAACSRRPQSGCASAILHPRIAPKGRSAFDPYPFAAGRPKKARPAGSARYRNDPTRCRPRPGYFTASVGLRPLQLGTSVITARGRPKRIAEKRHYLQRRNAEAVHAPPLSNLQDAWKGFKIPRMEIKTSRNKIKVRRNEIHPAERNPNLGSFHESRLFNGLSPTLTGRPRKTAPRPFARGENK